MILETLGFFYYWSPWDLLMIPGMLLGLYAQHRLTSTYGRYLEVGSAAGLTGEEAARRILDSAGLSSVPVYEVPGRLTDHYDPIKRSLFLSTENFHGASLSAVGVAAHEAGHALQHKEAYAPLHFRMALVPLVNFASSGAWVAFLIGTVLMGMRSSLGSNLMGIGIGLFAILTLFQLVTLPVEFDASRRAKRQLAGLGLVDRDELNGVSAVLGAAAMTYVAGLTSSVLELLRWIMIARSFDSRDNR